MRDDDDFKRNGGGRVDAIKKDGRRERRRERRVATIQTRFCARFYDASTTPSRMDIRQKRVMLEREEEETSTKPVGNDDDRDDQYEHEFWKRKPPQTNKRRREEEEEEERIYPRRLRRLATSDRSREKRRTVLRLSIS